MLLPPDSGFGAIRRLDQGQKYLESWEKYEKDLAEWKKKIEAGEKIEKSKQEEVEEIPEEKLDDPDRNLGDDHQWWSDSRA